jgi:hypothetical protein
MYLDFYGERLRLARLLKGVTLQELGDAVSVSDRAYTSMKAMQGLLQWMSEMLWQNTLKSPSFFGMPMAGDVKPEQCHFRKRQTTPVG